MHDRRNPFLSPIYHELDGLEPGQRNRARQIGFWVLFAYVNLWWLEMAAPALVIATLGILAAAFLPMLRPVVRRPHFTAMNAGILGAMLLDLLVRPTTTMTIDALLVGAAFAAGLSSSKLRWTAAAGVVHAASIFWNPWCSLETMNTSPAIAAHGFARMFAAGLAAAIVIHAYLRRAMPPPPVAPAPPPAKPLTVAQWEAQNPAPPHT